MTTSAGASSDVSILLREARKNGFKTIPGGGGHKKIVDHRGKVIVDNNGPLILSSSPSDARWREMTVKRWMAAGVIKRDPFKGDEPVAAVRGKRGLKGGAVSGKDGGSRLADPDVQKKKVDAIKARAARERADTLVLREQLEPIIVKIGGWGAGTAGKVKQIADVAWWFNDWRGHVDTFSSESAARGAVQSLKSGQTLNERNRKAFAFFLDELTKNADPAARYFELYRLSKGLPAKEGDETLRGGTPLSDPPPKEEREKQKDTNGHGSRERVGPATRPSLALEIVAQMMVGRTEVDDRILKLGEEIQELELRERGYA